MLSYSVLYYVLSRSHSTLFGLLIALDYLPMYVFTAARRDFRIDFEKNCSQISLGLCKRLIQLFYTKYVSDFSSMIEVRHPIYLGGALWSYNMIQGVLWCIISMIIAKSYNGKGMLELSERIGFDAIVVAFCLTIVLIVSFTILLWISNSKFYKTFTDKRSIQNFMRDNFNNYDDDEIR